MAKFTAPVDLNIHLPGGFEVIGTAGTTHRIPDSLVTEFIRDQVSVIPGGVTWITQDETTASAITLPIAESDVTGLVSDLAGKAASIHAHAESSVTNLTTDLALKYDKTGGTISGAATVTGTLGVTGLATMGSIIASAVTATTARFKGAPWFDVRAYGATGDGTTDDRTAVASAITAAEAVHGRVFFPAGTYKNAGAAWNISSAIEIVGEGGWISASVITVASANIGAFNFQSTADHSRIGGLRIAGAGGASTGSGITARKTVHMDDIWVSGFFDGVAVGADGSYYAEMRLVFSSDNGNAGIKLETGCYNTTIIHPRLQGNVVGLTGVSYTNLRIYGGSIEQNTTRGIEATGTVSRNLLVSGTYFESAVGTEDIRLGGAATLNQAVIEGCKFQDNTVVGYWHINAFVVNGLTLIGNIIGSAGSTGGSLQTASTTEDVVAINNKIDGTKTISTVHRYFEIGTLGGMRISGPRADNPSSNQVLVAGTAILATHGVVMISAASAITLTATPTIASPNFDGQRLTIINIGTQNITLQDQGTLASSNLRLTATGVTLTARDSIELIYMSQYADWVQIGNLVSVV